MAFPPSPIPSANSAPAVLRCPACSSLAQLTSTSVIWRNVDGAALYVCGRYPSCDTYVRCHAGTNTPLGTLAGPVLRKLRGLAHKAFDPLWQVADASIDRDLVYRIAGEVLEIEDFHIGFLDEAGCRHLMRCIPRIDDAITAHLAKRSASTSPPSEWHLEIVEALFTLGGGAYRSSVPASEILSLARVSEDLIKKGVLRIDGDEAHLTPHGSALIRGL